MRRLVAVLLLASAAASAQQPSSGFHEEVEVRVMDLDVVVTDKAGRPVPDLKREDFTVRVGGKVVPIDYFARVEEGAIQLPSSGLTFIPEGDVEKASADVAIGVMDDSGRSSDVARQEATFPAPQLNLLGDLLRVVDVGELDEIPERLGAREGASAREGSSTSPKTNGPFASLPICTEPVSATIRRPDRAAAPDGELHLRHEGPDRSGPSNEEKQESR